MRRSHFANWKRQESEFFESPQNNKKSEKSVVSLGPKQPREINKFLDYCQSKSADSEGSVFRDEGPFTTFRISDLRDFLKNSSTTQKD